MTASRRRRTLSLADLEILEPRTLLAAVVDSIQIRNQAPVVLPDVNGVELLAAETGDSTELYTTTGTEASLELFATIPAELTDNVYGQFVVGDIMYLAAEGADSTQLWRTNGTADGTFLIAAGISEHFDDYAVLGDDLYFVAATDSSVGRELYKTDGTVAGTMLVKDIIPNYHSHPFSVYGTGNGTFEIWINHIDESGTLLESGIVRETSLPADQGSYRTDQLPNGHYTYWTRRTDTNGVEANWSPQFRTEVVNGARSGQPTTLTVFNNEVYFAAVNEENSFGLWKTDGTESGTVGLGELNSSSYLKSISTPIPFDGHLYFSANTNGFPQAIWRVDGNGSAPSLVSSEERLVAAVNGRLLTVRSHDGRQQVVAYDSAADTVPDVIVDAPESTTTGYDSIYTAFAMVGDRLSFLALDPVSVTGIYLSPSDDRHGVGLPRYNISQNATRYLTDGTPEGTNALPGGSFQTSSTDIEYPYIQFEVAPTQTIGNTTYINHRGGWALTPNGATRTGESDTIVGDYAFGVRSPTVVHSVDTAGEANELNVLFSNATDVDEIAGAAWVTADHDSGTALLKVDLSVNEIAGPAITAPTDSSAPAGEVSFEWTPLADSVGEEIRIRRDNQGFTQITRLNDLAATSHSQDLNAGGYFLDVRSHFSDGTFSLWTTHFLTVQQPPTGPVITSSHGDEHLTTPTVGVTWQAQTEAITYEVRSNGAGDQAPDAVGIAGTTYAAPLVGGSNFIEVRSRFADGSVSAWTHTAAFDASPPLAVTSVEATDQPRVYSARFHKLSFSSRVQFYLVNDSTGDAQPSQETYLAANSESLTFEVPFSGRFRLVTQYRGIEQFFNKQSEVSESVFDATIPFAESRPFIADAIDTSESLDLYFSDTDEFTEYEVRIVSPAPQRTFTGITTNEFSFDPEGRQNVTVEVTALNVAGQRSQSTTTGFSRDRLPLELVSGDGTQSTAFPTFAWTPASDRYPDVTQYEVFLYSPGQTYRELESTGTGHTVRRSLQAGDYSIYVRAHFADGTASRWPLPVGTITVAPVTSGPPTILAPQQTSSTRLPSFEWEQNPDASHYELWVSGTNDVAPLIHEQNLQSPSFAPATEFASGEYRMWVRTHLNNGGSTRWTATYRFTIQSGVVQVTGGVGDQPSATPTIEWEAQPNATHYQLYINPVEFRHEPTYRRFNLTGTSHTLETDLLAGVEYEVWVRAHFANASPSPWGTAPPTVIVENSFANFNPQLAANGTTITWPAASGVTQYELWINQMDPNDPRQTILVRAHHGTSTTTSVETDLTTGVYRAWLRGIDATGNTSIWSPQFNFSV